MQPTGRAEADDLAFTARDHCRTKQPLRLRLLHRLQQPDTVALRRGFPAGPFQPAPAARAPPGGELTQEPGSRAQGSPPPGADDHTDFHGQRSARGKRSAPPGPAHRPEQVLHRLLRLRRRPHHLVRAGGLDPPAGDRAGGRNRSRRRRGVPPRHPADRQQSRPQHPADQRQGPRADAAWPTSPGLSSPRRSRREPTSAAGCHGTATPSSYTPWNTSTLKPSAPPADPPHRRPRGSPRLACTVLRIRLAAGSVALMESELVVEGGVDVARNASVR